jgi:acetyl-CoA C-acetyltransferase
MPWSCLPLSDGVAIIGVGHSGFSPSTRSKSYKELMFEAASMAYRDAGVDPRRDVGSFVCCEEDLWEGNSIADEYVPDQIGAALRPTCTVTSDGIGGLATALMQVRSGLADVVAVEAHSKLSDVVSKDDIIRFAYDPVFARSLAAEPLFLAGLEMNRFLYDTGNSAEACAEVASLNLANGLLNERASYGSDKTPAEVLSSRTLSFPLTEMEVSRPADGCVVLVVASAARSKAAKNGPVWIRGIGWASGTPWVQSMDFSRATYASLSAKMAFRMAGVDSPKVDLCEVDDTFAYKELQHLEAIGICRRGEAGRELGSGRFSPGGDLPVNASGGSLGVGHLLDASGLHRTLEACLQLRGEAKRAQVKGAKSALVQGWRGIPTASGAVALLEVE